MEKPEQTTAPHPPPDPKVPQEDEPPCLYCPNCSSRLVSRHCELICTRCGYYMSCSDYV